MRHLDVVSDCFKKSLENTPSREKVYFWWRFSSAIETLWRSELLTHGIPNTLLKRRKHFTQKQWIGLAKLLADSPIHLANLLDHTEPSKRAEIFEAVFPENQRQNRIFPECLLYTLPHMLRTKEATRILGLREIYDNREKAMTITLR